VIFRQLFDPESSSYTYLLAGAGSEALLVDPVLARVEQYLRLLHELGLRLAAALDTHLHADHLSGVGALRERTACRTALRGEELVVAGLRLRVIQTPGHTEDARCFLLADRVFTGDTLLIRSAGRTDLPGGDARAQWRSLQKLLALPDATLVYPGHDYKGETVSTIGEERAHNPRLRARSEDEFAVMMGELRLEPPKLMNLALFENRRLAALG
jgi:glyoxylase-like metal-dependent hydrolase (beta-lactamase superfamily II)